MSVFENDPTRCQSCGIPYLSKAAFCTNCGKMRPASPATAAPPGLRLHPLAGCLLSIPSGIVLLALAFWVVGLINGDPNSPAATLFGYGLYAVVGVALVAAVLLAIRKKPGLAIFVTGSVIVALAPFAACYAIMMHYG